MKVIMERYPYRYVESGVLENGSPDYRIQSMMSILGDTKTCIFVTTVCNSLLLLRISSIQNG